MADWQLLAPEWLVLLLALWPWLKQRKKLARELPTITPPLSLKYPPATYLAQAPLSAVHQKNARTQNLLLGGALALLIVSLSQPVQLTQPIIDEAEQQPVDLVLLVGTSISMRLRDYQFEGKTLDRMSLAKRYLDEFVQAYQGRRIGLVIMGNPPSLWLPLTTDKQAVRHAISRIKPVMSGRLSDTGSALALVKQHFASTDEKVVLMITDGGLQLGEVAPTQAAKQLSQEAFTLHVIGLGATEGETVSTEVGGLLFQPINLEMLNSIATAGGGKLFHVADTSDFQLALNTIEQQHTKPPVTNKEAPRLMIPWYPLPLGLGLVLLLLAFTTPRWSTPSGAP